MFRAVGEFPAGVAQAIVAELGEVPADFFKTSALGPGVRSLCLLIGVAPTDTLVLAVQQLRLQGCRFGLIPCSSPDAARNWLRKALELDPELQIDPCRVVLSSLNGPGPFAPPTYLKGQHASLERVLSADLLLVSGHSNQVDGALGSGMVACSRFAPGEGSEGSDFPCRHGHGCFRQLDQNLPLEHEANLLDLARLNAQISVFIGCNMLFGHGSWFHGEATLIDRLSRSRVRAAIATIGVATYSPDVEALVLYGLSAGMTLGEVCDLLNGHFASRVSSVGLPRGVGPMFVIGDHRVRVRGLSFAEPSVSQGQRGEIAISCPDASHALGWMRAVSPPRPLAPGQSLEVTSSAPWMWSTYVTASNTVLVWLFDACSAPHTVDIRWSPSRFELERRQLVELDHWTEVCTALAECVRGKGGNAKPFDDVALLHRQLSADLEKVLIQRAAARFEVIIRDVDALVDMEHLVGDLREADQIRVAAVASHVNLIGTRLFHLWQSKWQVTQVDCQTGDRCSCGGALFSSLFEGVLDERRREILSCPSCGPVHEGPAAAGWPASRPLHASLETPVAVAGSLLTWSVRNCASKSAHLALALQDWYRSASITTDAIELAPGECRRISLELPATLHPGAYPAAVVASFGGELSLRRQMCNVSRRPAVLRRLPAD